MPYKNPEDKKKHDKEYYLKNKERIQQRTKLYFIQNREKILDKSKEYYKNNIEYYKSEEMIKKSRISKWKSRGLITEDIDKLYEYYLSIEECEHCGILLDEDEATRKCMDHSHTTGQFRNILCKTCNTIRRG
mgnify:CR=1 FL=1|tara:strand:+ start:11 stop:406 length:396 start_codon:yes stop_codon:yes gene_type:complete